MRLSCEVGGGLRWLRSAVAQEEYVVQIEIRGHILVRIFISQEKKTCWNEVSVGIISKSSIVISRLYLISSMLCHPLSSLTISFHRMTLWSETASELMRDRMWQDITMTPPTSEIIGRKKLCLIPMIHEIPSSNLISFVELIEFGEVAMVSSSLTGKCVVRDERTKIVIACPVLRRGVL